MDGLKWLEGGFDFIDVVFCSLFVYVVEVWFGVIIGEDVFECVS